MNPNKSMTLIGTAIVIAAAGGSGVAVAGIDGSGATKPKNKITKGPVTGFGSVFVNGVRFDTDYALFLINGEFGSESELEVGQIVTVHGWVNADGATGQAMLVTYDDAIQGPVDHIDVSAGHLDVLGHSVIVDDDTAFSDELSSLADLALSDVVEVSGYADASGHIRATHIGIESGDDDFDLHGIVDLVDSADLRIVINGVEIDYSAANLLGFEFGQPEVGARVRIVAVERDDDGDLVATRIERRTSSLMAAAGAEVSIEGLITGSSSLFGFEIDGVPVRLRWGTEFVNGSLFGLAPDARIDVEGRFDDDGVLIADRIEFERSAELSTRGTVQAVFGDALMVDGRIVRVTPETGYDDRSVADQRRFSVGDVRPGDSVEIRGYESGSVLMATWLQRNGAVESEPRSFGDIDERD